MKNRILWTILGALSLGVGAYLVGGWAPFEPVFARRLLLGFLGVLGILSGTYIVASLPERR